MELWYGYHIPFERKERECMKTISREKFIMLIFRLLVLILFLMALFISSAKVCVIFGILAVLLVVLSTCGVCFQKWIPILFAGAFLLLNLYYNQKNLNTVNPMTRITSQTIYQQEQYENQIYPDNFIRLLIRDKRILLPEEVKLYSEYSSYGRDTEEGNPFAESYFVDNNYTRYFKAFSKASTFDPALKTIDGIAVTDRERDFVSLGISNDFLRYSFLLNEENIQQASYFWYSWYYYSLAEEEQKYPEVWVNLKGIAASEALVAVWDKDENLYLMSEEYYREEVVSHE